MSFKGYRCIGACNVDINETTEVGEERLWSDPNSWPDGKVPVDGDNVHIESGWNMTMDIANGTMLRLVRINGILRFKQDMDITFRAKHIFIRAG